MFASSEALPTFEMDPPAQRPAYARMRKFSSILLITILVTAGLFYYFETDKISKATTSTVAPVVNEQTLEVVTASELPAVAEIQQQPQVEQVAAVAEEQVSTTTESQIAPAQEIAIEANRPIDINARSFTLKNDPRLGSDGEFLSVTTEPAKAEGATSHLGKLGLRPVPSSDGRFVSPRSNLEWQGGWELKNPAANADRGERYLQYLKGKFNQNADGSLMSISRGKTRLSESLGLPEAGASGLRTYGK